MKDGDQILRDKKVKDGGETLRGKKVKDVDETLRDIGQKKTTLSRVTVNCLMQFTIMQFTIF